MLAVVLRISIFALSLVSQLSSCAPSCERWPYPDRGHVVHCSVEGQLDCSGGADGYRCSGGCWVYMSDLCRGGGDAPPSGDAASDADVGDGGARDGASSDGAGLDASASDASTAERDAGELADGGTADVGATDADTR